MAKNESSKSKAEVYREERKARIAKAAKKNAKSIEKRNTASKIAQKVISVLLIVAIVGGIGWKLVDDFGIIEKHTTAVKVGEHKISETTFNYYYSMQYNQLSSQADYYAQMGYNMGFDSSIPADEQDSTSKDEDGNTLTWADVIKTSAVNQAQSITAYYNEAVKAGMELTDDEKAEIDETVENYRTQAASNNYSLNAYLRANFGGGFNEKAFRKQLEMETLAKNFHDDKQDELKNGISDEEIKAEYDKNTKDYNYTDVRYFTFSFTTLTAKDGETDDALAARQKEANDKVIAEAKAVYEKVTDEDTLIAAAKEYKNKDKEKKDDTDPTTLSENASYSSLTSAISEKGADWAFDNARKAGDKTMITGDKAVYIIISVKPSFETNSVTVRHCLVKFDAEDSENVTEEEKKATYDKAKALYDEWLKGDKSEDSFATFAEKNTEDEGSATTGGLYENIRVSDSYVEPFLDWSFDSARKAGDSGIIETEYGYHIMFFVSNNTDDLDWKNSIREKKGSEAFEAYSEELLGEEGTYVLVENDKRTTKVEKDYCDKIRRNLAYSSAYGS